MMRYKVKDLSEMETVVEALIIDDLITDDNAELISYGDLNYDSNGFVLGFDNNGKIEYDIVAIYTLSITRFRNNNPYSEEMDIYLRIRDIPNEVKDLLIEEIELKSYLPVN